MLGSPEAQGTWISTRCVCTETTLTSTNAIQATRASTDLSATHCVLTLGLFCAPPQKHAIQDLLVPPGTSVSEATAKDAAQMQQLTAAATAARAHAVALISGQPASDDSSAASRRSVGKAQGVVAKAGGSGGGEIEAVGHEEPAESKSIAGVLGIQEWGQCGRGCVPDTWQEHGFVWCW
jgi:hypothetical protein